MKEARLIVLLVGMFSSNVFADDSMAIFRAYYEADLQRTQAWADLAKRRLDMVQKAIERAEYEKKRAGVERDDLRLGTERLRAKHELFRFLNEELAIEKDRPGYNFGEVKGKFAQRRAEVRDIFRDKYLNLPEASTSEIWKGRALNTFLALCKQAAINQDIQLRQREEQRQLDTQRLQEVIEQINSRPGLENLRLEINSQGLLPRAQYRAAVEHPDLPVGDRQGLTDAQERVATSLDALDMLNRLGSQSALGADDVNNLTFTKGGRRKLRISPGSDETLPFDWPAIIKREERYRELVAEFERAKETAIDSLRQDKDIPGEIQSKLAALYYEFKVKVNEDFTKWIRENIQQPPIKDQAHEAKHFLPRLQSQIGYLVAADSIDDLSVESASSITNAQELLVYMSRNGLHFDEAESMHETSYEAVFEALKNYYLDLKSFQSFVAVRLREQEDDLETSRRREDESYQREWRDSVDIFERVMRANQPEQQSIMSLELNTESNEMSQAMSAFNTVPSN